MIEGIKAFFTNSENINEIALIVVGILIGLLATVIGKMFKWLGQFLWTCGKKALSPILTRIKKLKVERKYKKTIKQIERMKIPIPKNFLLTKSPEKNPELKKIYQMMDEGQIKQPNSYRHQKLLLKELEDNPELNDVLKDVKIDVSKSPPIKHNLPEIKLPPFKK